MQIGLLPPELKSIEQLFAGNLRFSVPRYQRSFAWTSDETQELWEDVLNAAKRKNDFFLGTVVLHNRSATEPQEIIDGQQRLACITMLFSAIRNVFLANHDAARAARIQTAFLGSTDFSRDATITPKLVLNRVNDTTFRDCVLESNDAAEIASFLKDTTLKPSNRLLLEAYQFFLAQIHLESANQGTQADNKFLVPLIDTLREKLKLITITVMSEEDANLFFESLNARGRELAISDLVKNRLYFETKNQVDKAEQLWEQMEGELGRRPVPEFIRHYWIAKKVPKDSAMVREKHLYRMITQAVSGPKPAVELITDLRKSATDYARISDYSLWSDDAAFDESLKKPWTIYAFSE